MCVPPTQPFPLPLLHLSHAIFLSRASRAVHPSFHPSISPSTSAPARTADRHHPSRAAVAMLSIHPTPTPTHTRPTDRPTDRPTTTSTTTDERTNERTNERTMESCGRVWLWRPTQPQLNPFAAAFADFFKTAVQFMYTSPYNAKVPLTAHSHLTDSNSVHFMYTFRTLHPPPCCEGERGRARRTYFVRCMNQSMFILPEGGKWACTVACTESVHSPYTAISWGRRLASLTHRGALTVAVAAGRKTVTVSDCECTVHCAL